MSVGREVAADARNDVMRKELELYGSPLLRPCRLLIFGAQVQSSTLATRGEACRACQKDWTDRGDG